MKCIFHIYRGTDPRKCWVEMLLQRAEAGVQEGGGVSAGNVHGGRFGGIASGQ